MIREWLYDVAACLGLFALGLYVIWPIWLAVLAVILGVSWMAGGQT